MESPDRPQASIWAEPWLGAGPHEGRPRLPAPGSLCALLWQLLPWPLASSPPSLGWNGSARRRRPAAGAAPLSSPDTEGHAWETDARLHGRTDPETQSLRIALRRNQISLAQGAYGEGTAQAMRGLGFSGLSNDWGEHSLCTKHCNKSLMYSNSLEPHSFPLRFYNYLFFT